MNQPDLPFGGITVAFGGDFQQALPIIPKGTKEQIIGAYIQRSRLWRHIKALHLTENMRVDPNDQESAQFEQWLLDVRQGKDLPLNHHVKWQNTTWSWSGEPELTEGTWLQLMCCATSRSRCPKCRSNGVHGVYKDILEYTRGDGEDRETRGSRKWVHYGPYRTPVTPVMSPDFRYYSRSSS